MGNVMHRGKGSFTHVENTVFFDRSLSLKAKGIIKHADALVKVLGDGEITKALTVQVDKVSASAKAKIEAAGGKVEEPC